MKEAGEPQSNEHIPDGECCTGPKWENNDGFSLEIASKDYCVRRADGIRSLWRLCLVITALYCKWWQIIQAGALNQLQITKCKLKMPGILGSFGSGTLTRNAVNFSITETEGQTPAVVKSTDLWCRGVVAGTTDCCFALMGCRWYKNLLLNKNDTVWWLEIKQVGWHRWERSSHRNILFAPVWNMPAKALLTQGVSRQIPHHVSAVTSLLLHWIQNKMRW